MTINHSESFAAVASALARAQKAFGAIVKNREGQTGNQRYKYADLSDVLDQVRDPLIEAKLTLISGSEVVYDERGATVATESRLIHESGEWLSTTVTLVCGDNIKDVGGAQTYGRRYGISALLGVASEPDDDASSVSTRRQVQAAQAAPPPQPPNELQSVVKSIGSYMSPEGYFGGAEIAEAREQTRKLLQAKDLDQLRGALRQLAAEATRRQDLVKHGKARMVGEGDARFFEEDEDEAPALPEAPVSAEEKSGAARLQEMMAARHAYLEALKATEPSEEYFEERQQWAFREPSIEKLREALADISPQPALSAADGDSDEIF